MRLCLVVLFLGSGSLLFGQNALGNLSIDLGNASCPGGCQPGSRVSVAVSGNGALTNKGNAPTCGPEALFTMTFTFELQHPSGAVSPILFDRVIRFRISEIDPLNPNFPRNWNLVSHNLNDIPLTANSKCYMETGTYTIVARHKNSTFSWNGTPTGLDYLDVNLEGLQQGIGLPTYLNNVPNSSPFELVVGSFDVSEPSANAVILTPSSHFDCVRPAYHLNAQSASTCHNYRWTYLVNDNPVDFAYGRELCHRSSSLSQVDELMLEVLDHTFVNVLDSKTIPINHDPTCFAAPSGFDDFCKDFAVKKTDGNEIKLFEVYPNPAVDFLYIEIDNNSDPVQLRIYDRIGRLIIAKRLTELKNRISLVGMSSGFYHAILTGGNMDTQIRKIIIQ